ncbi:MAG: replicative DNA helicase [Oscillospiraceae bacterium]|nr:replicative DNA helicase [Oscillospiraceae bacterium]
MEDLVLRRQPYSAEAEQAVLGSILIDSATVATAVTMLKPDDFYIPENAKIYETLVSMFTGGEKIDPITLLDKLKELELYDDAGGRAYLYKLMDATPSAVNIEAYAAIVKDKAKLRKLADVTGEANTRAMGEVGSVAEQLETLEQQLFELRGERSGAGLVPIREALNDSLREMKELASQGGKLPGLPTGFRDLDFYISGLNRSDLIILAARPGVGKTSVALNIARYAAEAGDGKNVLLFNLEMSRVQLVQRMLSSEALVELGKLRTANMVRDEWDRLVAGALKLAKLPIYVDDTSNITVAEIKARVRRVRDVGLVVIDYLQLIKGGRKDGNRVLEVSDISRSLKVMAKELNVPVLCLAQLSRASEQRKDDPKPKLSDLRDSGAIEQDADIVLFLYRDEQYHPDTAEKNVCDCIIAKNRHGQCNTVQFQWQGQFTRFTMRDRIHEKPQ